MKPGDPTPRSPAEVLKDRTYRMVHSHHESSSLVHLVVFHCGTETYWQTRYGVYAYDVNASWEEVRPREMKATIWEKVI